MRGTVLAIDIGNTSTTLGLCRGGAVTRVHRLERSNQTARSIRAVITATLGTRTVTAAALASVVPDVNEAWISACTAVTGIPARLIQHQLDLGVGLDYPHPETIGADRLANAAGAADRYETPVVVADFGTAVTFDVVTRSRGYIGGIIAPGLPLMFDYLAERTALLPRVDWAPVRHRIGRNTREAMQLGAHWGYRGMVREIIAELRKSPGLRHARLVATGGFAARVLDGLKPAPLIDPTLTLHGIACIARRNPVV
jgi:type III pantothenate kinase